MRLWAWGQSDPGKKRERNEDSYLVDPALGVMAVADGMGGHQGGATASRMAVELLSRELVDARGDFDAAVRKQKEVSIRTTEEMPVQTSPIGDLAPTVPNETDDTLPAGGAFATRPTTTVMLSSPPRSFASSMSCCGNRRYQVIATMRSSSACSM